MCSDTPVAEPNVGYEVGGWHNLYDDVEQYPTPSGPPAFVEQYTHLLQTAFSCHKEKKTIMVCLVCRIAFRNVIICTSTIFKDNDVNVTDNAH